jgi:hypothetical protein
MIKRIARLLLRLYPLAFQRRYGEEMRALLEQQPPRARAALDLLRGALREHLRPSTAAAELVGPDDRVRASTSGILLCWVFFAAAGFGYYKTTEDAPFWTAGHAHPLLQDAHLAVQAVALIAGAAVALGALPLIASALVHARRERSLLRVVGAPLSPVVVFGGLTAAVILIAHAQPAHRGSAVGSAVAVIWGIAGLACGTACVVACRRALFATPIKPARLRIALASGTLLTMAMFAIALAVSVYGAALILDASPLAASPNGPFQVLTTGASLIIEVVVMAALSVLAATAARRGWRGGTQTAD